MSGIVAVEKTPNLVTQDAGLSGNSTFSTTPNRELQIINYQAQLLSQPGI